MEKDNKNIQDDIILTNQECGLVLSDQKEALGALAMDKEFVEKLISQKTLKSMQQLFNNRGVVLSEKEIDDFIEMVKASVTKTELPDEFFEDAAAGSSVLNNAGTYQLINSIASQVNDEKNDNGGMQHSIFWL